MLNNSLRLNIKKAEKMDFFSSNLSKTNYLFLVSNNNYLNLKNDSDYVTMHKITTSNWENTLDVINELRNTIKYGQVFSKITNYKSLNRGYQTFFFVVASLAFMFFVSTGCVTYFKMFNELEDEKNSFYKLYKIGITAKEIQGIINKELAFVYFTPLIFGGVLGLSIMYYMTNLFTFGLNTSFVSTFMLRGFYAWLIYLGFQFILYFLFIIIHS